MTLRVLHATAWYAPHHVGGTEIYVEGLVDALASRGIAGTVLTPRTAGAPARYRHAGHTVATYPGRAVTGAARPGLDAFRRLLEANPAEIYHQHSWTGDCGPGHLETARALGFRTVLTVHVPGVTCLRGTMLRFGTEPCDGWVEARRCGGCWAHGKGMPRGIAAALARLPLPVAERLRKAPGRLATALAARAIGAEREGQVRSLIAGADRIVAVCGWLAEALLANGVPPERLILNRQGLSDDLAVPAPIPPSPSTPPSLLYLGRWDPVKGVDVLVRAVRRSTAPLRLTLRGVAQTAADRAYEAEVRAIAGDDPRIRFAPPVGRADLMAEMARHDVLAVPSRWLETGPLVVLEARRAGLYVLGSRLGGIAELLEPDGGGQLVAAGDVPAWTAAVDDVVARGVRRGPPRDVRTMSDVAAEMAGLYGSLLEDASGRAGLPALEGRRTGG